MEIALLGKHHQIKDITRNTSNALNFIVELIQRNI